MDIEIAIFLLLFLSLGLLATIGVEIRSCWRNYRMRKYRHENYLMVEPPDECICNIVPQAMTSSMMVTTTSDIADANHLPKKLDELDEEDAPPQDLLDALVLGEGSQRTPKNQIQNRQKIQNQFVFAKNVTTRKNGDLV
jgi:hypothetical protein